MEGLAGCTHNKLGASASFSTNGVLLYPTITSPNNCGYVNWSLTLCTQEWNKVEKLSGRVHMMETSRDTSHTDSFTSHRQGLKRSWTTFCDILHSTVIVLVTDYFVWRQCHHRRSHHWWNRRVSPNLNIPLLTHTLFTSFWPLIHLSLAALPHPTTRVRSQADISWDQPKLGPQLFDT